MPYAGCVVPCAQSAAVPWIAEWIARVKEEYRALIEYQRINKEAGERPRKRHRRRRHHHPGAAPHHPLHGPCAGNEWFTIESNKTGTRWTGKVWYFHDRLKYEYDLEFDLPVTYPNVAPELALPELDGKTEKMCLSRARTPPPDP